MASLKISLWNCSGCIVKYEKMKDYRRKLKCLKMKKKGWNLKNEIDNINKYRWNLKDEIEKM